MHPLALFKYCPKCGSAHFLENNEKSKRCLDCGFVYYFNPSAATVAFILNQKEELLVCRRGKEPAKGTFDLSGGFLDMYETGEQGIAREVLEETGLEVTETNYLFSIPNTYLYSGFLVHTLDQFFLCKFKWDFYSLQTVKKAFYMPVFFKNFTVCTVSCVVNTVSKKHSSVQERNCKFLLKSDFSIVICNIFHNLASKYILC